jgi:hypothetical protein
VNPLLFGVAWSDVDLDPVWAPLSGEVSMVAVGEDMLLRILSWMLTSPGGFTRLGRLRTFSGDGK